MAAPLCICAQIVVFPQGRCEEGPFDVFVEKGLTAAIERCTGNCGSEKLTCHFLTPGFVDIHNHGMGKLSFSSNSQMKSQNNLYNIFILIMSFIKLHIFY